MAALSMLALSGCVASNSLQTQDTAAALTPAEDVATPQTADPTAMGLTTDADVAKASEEQLLPSAEATALAPTAETSAAVASTDLAKTAEPVVESVEIAAAPEPAKAKPVNPLASFFTASEPINKPKRPKAGIQKKKQLQPVRTASRSTSRASGTGTLPGVRSGGGLFGIIATTNERNGSDTRNKNDRDQLASVTNLGRAGSTVFAHQRKGIRSDCFPRALVAILKRVERHYGKPVVITSGFRSQSYNRRIRGARNSTHTKCLAADIQVEGVSKWQLAKYMRSIPGRGGVGTYCWTKSVHIDIGAKRAWHYCNRRKKRRA
ncbi:peptidase M15A [Ahrensia sp. R2A130]|nr:peptidase M15A [Ahrensia sp. R2A130]